MKKVQYNKKTHEQFLIDLQTRQPDLFSNIKVIGEYEKGSKHILVSTKYGDCLILAFTLLDGQFPSIQSAIDKTEYFKNVLKESQPDVFNSIEIIGEYISDKNKILVKTEYGTCLVRPSHLLSGHKPLIRSSIDKNQYFINMAKKIHGNKYDYSLVDYKGAFGKVKIISSEGIFEQTASMHLMGAGCPVLGRKAATKYQQDNPMRCFKDSNYVNKAFKSERFDSFKVYIIKCYNNNEVFYKIGKTYVKIKERFKDKRTMPYKYLIIKEIIFDKTEEGGLACCKLERRLQAENKDFKYIPEIKFGGQYECFSSIDNLIIKRELI